MIGRVLVIAGLAGGVVFAEEPYCRTHPVVYCNDFEMATWDDTLPASADSL